VSFEPIVLAPEQIAEEIFPYRRVWRTAWLEVALLALIVLTVWALSDLLGVIDPATRTAPIKIGLALVPLFAWLFISYWTERRAPIPRPHLVGLLALGALSASGIMLPLEQSVFTPDRWLPTAGFFGRVLGYTFTLGVTAEFTKYLVMRYTVWPRFFTQRTDGIAYALAVSVGFATVLNLRFALQPEPTVSAVALRIASITFSQVGVGVIMGFFLAELHIGRVPVFWLPMGLFLASFLSGLYYGFRGIAIVGGLSVEGDGSAPIRGFFLALGVVILLFPSLSFIIQNADARMEALTGRRGTL